MNSDYKKIQRELKKKYRPESLAPTYGYDSNLSEGAMVPPIFLSSTFVFKNAEEAKRSFELAYHLRKRRPREETSLIYSRLNNPDLEILEDRMTLFEKGTERAAVFTTGMAAITTTILSICKTHDTLLFSTPVYGGTDYLFRRILPRLGIKTVPFVAGSSGEMVANQIRTLKEKNGEKPSMIFLETPANPNCALTDIREMADVARDASKRSESNAVKLAVDNTFLGPMWQNPGKHGADVVLYSATKFISGHSDVVAGVALGNEELIEDNIKVYRTILGTILSPFDGYLLLRSLETLKMRMTAQAKNARYVANWLSKHPKVEHVYFPGLLEDRDPQKRILEKQCTNAGSMVSFDIRGGRRQAFHFLNSLKLARLAVSLGGTKTLAEHPSTMTHSDLDVSTKRALGITEKMVRLSVGVEYYADIIDDLEQAMDQVSVQ
jgi:methionine-gamma-lyase